jgi:uncharacterized membrane protein HdeD (DUF308 family)
MFMLLSQYWWVLVVRGIMAILFGALAFMLPMATLSALILVFGAYAFVDGMFAIAAAIAEREATPQWWVLLLQGLLGAGVGVLTLFNPGITAVALLVYIAAWAVASGVLQVVAAVRLRHQLTAEWLLALGGVLAVGFGALLMWRPAEGALALLRAIAAFAILWGVMLMIGGLDIRRLRKRVAG